MSENKVKRNGTIDLMSFVFCLTLIFSDFAGKFDIVSFKHLTFFGHGTVGIEFFLLTAGALTAASAKRHTEGTLAQRTGRFMGDRLLRILPYHFITFFGALAVFVYLKRRLGFEDMLQSLIDMLPNLFMIQKSGLKETELNTPEWWIAGMLWCMLIIYPLILRFKGYFTRIAAPLLMILLVGYMAHETGKLSSMNTFLYADMISKAYLRCFAGLCGGVFGYEVACYLQKLKFTKADRILLSLIELFAYAVTLLYACSDFAAKLEPYAYYALFVAVTLSFSHRSVFASLLDNGLTQLLGKTVLPLYFCHVIPLMLLKVRYIKGQRLAVKLLFVLAVTALLAVIVEWLAQHISGAIDAKRSRQE